MKVGIVFGGPSVEHDISIITASQILASLNPKKYEILPIYYSKDKKFYEVKNFDSLKNWTGDIKLLQEIPINRLQGKKRGKFGTIKYVDCIISAFHGKNTEGGELAGLFEVLDIPYSSNSILGASLGQDKVVMKKVLKCDEIDVLNFIDLTYEEYKNNEEKSIEKIEQINYPLIVKPSMLGSSIGIKKVNDKNELKKALNLAFKYDETVIIEQCLSDYREFNCAIFNNVVSEIEEVEVKNAIFTFKDKYQTHESKHILPANIDEELKLKIYELTKKTSVSLRNESIARIDFLYDNVDKKLYVNEINTIPGALSYYLFEAKGIYFDELLDKLIINTMKRDYKKKKLINHFESDVLNNKKSGLKMKK